MIFNAYFTTGRIIFMIFFVLAFGGLVVWSYRKDIQNHNRYYKNAGKKVLLYGGLIVAVCIAIRLIIGN